VAARVTSLYRQMAAQKAELERSNTELAQFASVVSHDLRVPLTSSFGWNEIVVLPLF
jgi:light-regulated signal transduction histidine kinase (bacteriophytochrome)